MNVAITPALLEGTLRVPASKSMAHRMLICAALAEGTSVIHGVDNSQDITATMGALAALGASFRTEGKTVTVCGIGGKAASAAAEMDCCESGSTLRFLIPVAAALGVETTFLGRGRLPQRPVTAYLRELPKNGVTFDYAGTMPFSLRGQLCAGTFELEGDVSSQYVTGLLFALPLLESTSRIRLLSRLESRPYVNLTLACLRQFGITVTETEDGYEIPGGQHYHAAEQTVEGDYSQAAFLAVLGAARGGVAVTGLREDSLQGDRAILDILARCGARIIRTDGAALFEKSALRGTEIDLADCPDLGPVLMVLGALCKGETVIRNAARLRMKESDRIAAMEQELRKMGAELFSTQDTVTVRGGALHGADGLYGHNDHRVVMALAVAAYAAGVPAAIGGAEAVNKSWPDFFETVRALGGKVELTDE